MAPPSCPLTVFRQALSALNRALSTRTLYLTTARRFLAWGGREVTATQHYLDVDQDELRPAVERLTR